MSPEERHFRYMTRGFRTWIGRVAKNGGASKDKFLKEYNLEEASIEAVRELTWPCQCKSSEDTKDAAASNYGVNTHFCVPESVYVAYGGKSDAGMCVQVRALHQDSLAAISDLRNAFKVYQDAKWSLAQFVPELKATPTLYLVFPKVDGLDLVDFGRSQTDLGILPSRTTFLEGMKQIGSGLAILHQNGLAHNDLSPENCMISRIKKKDGSVRLHFRIIDMGVCTRKTTSAMPVGAAQPFVAKDHLRPPEWLAADHCSMKEKQRRDLGDLFALGFTLFVLMLHLPPWPTRPKIRVQSDRIYRLFAKQKADVRTKNIERVVSCFWSSTVNLTNPSDTTNIHNPFQMDDYRALACLFSPQPHDRPAYQSYVKE